VLTRRTVGEWAGRTAQDPYGETLGQIAGAMFDRETGSPEWLIVVEEGDSAGALVPAGGASPTGRKVRVVATSEQVRSAPRAKLGDDLDIEEKRRAAQHYGLALDTDASPSGQLRRPEILGRPIPMQPGSQAQAGRSAALSRATPVQRQRIVGGLRAAHAMEQASLKLLAAMRWRMEDEALVHAVVLHHKQTNRHAERLRERLEELEEDRMRLLEWAAKTLAYAKAQAGRRHSQPDPHDLRDAHAFERREIAAYDELEHVALDAGDERTAKLCRDIRADEVATVSAIEHSRLWRQS
jgi:ferritin-like metal-binding protein YciE